MTVTMTRTRYGVYLRPSPELGRLAAEAFELLRRQYGLREAGSYPPHVTLVGSIALDDEVAESALVEALDGVLATASPVAVVNRGIIARPGDGIGYELGDAATDDAASLPELAGELMRVIAPLRVFPAGDWDVSLRRQDSAERFRPHLTLAGRELEGVDELSAEVYDFLTTAGFDGPSAFDADTVTLYRLEADEWAADYWKTMTWQIVRSWRLS